MLNTSFTSRINPSIFALALLLASFSCQKKDTTTNILPEENRFTTSILTKPGDLNEPMEMTFLNDGRIFLAERKGTVKSFDTKTGEMKTLGKIAVNTKYTNKEGRVSEAEEGLVGIIAHPDFLKNHWVYLYYAHPTEIKHVLSRFEIQGDSLNLSSEKVLLHVITQREICCHTGGGMVFDSEGNLFLTVGNNTANPTMGTSALDERPDRSSWDDQRAGGNTNDLRGKILRIHPEDDGSYTIPKGNLFPEGIEKTRPEIYTMGHRNPWRVSVDSETGYIYWGEVGPDASKDSIIGPRGHDEFNQARKPGFFGWPYFIGDNKPYALVDYATNTVGAKLDPEHPVNNSPNNTGLKDLPPAQKAFLWYPYANSPEFPLMGSSGRSATGGPVFRKADFENSKRPFPSYYEGKWLIVEFMRGWIMSVTMDDEGNYKSMERFLPNENFISAIDIKFGPEGDLYVLEYGSAWFRGNDNALIKRIEYNSGNRKPFAKAAVDVAAGALPLTVNFSSKGTMDYDVEDKDALKYEWTIKSENGFNKTLAEANPSMTLDQAGVYSVSFNVTDSKGESNSQALEVKVGNEPPSVAVDILKGNKTFFFNKSSIAYEIKVSDKEDGSVADKKIKADEVAVNFDYVPEGFDLIEIASNHKGTDEWATFSTGLNLINRSDCKSCHIIDKKSVGPSYLDIAQKYKNDAAGQEKIAGKIITGGTGVWGEHSMSAHPQISPQNAATMVKYIIGLAEKKSTTKAVALKGNFSTLIPANDNGRGGYLLRAAYKDKGTKEMQSLTSEHIVALRNPAFDPEKADFKQGTRLMTTPSRSFSMIGNGSYLGYKSLDLSGIKQIEMSLSAQPRSGAVGGTIEVHLDSPTGKILGQSELIVPKEVDFRRIIVAQNTNPAKPGQPTTPPPPTDFGSMRRRMSIQTSISLEAVDGMHDLYFVFVNPKAGANEVIMQMVEIGFRDEVKGGK